MFTFNQTIRSNMQSTQNLYSQSTKNNPFSTQRREKIKDLLVIKFMKKYGIKENDINIEEELRKFLKKEQISEHDLKNFDYKLRNLITERRSFSNLQRNLTLSDNNLNEYKDRPDILNNNTIEYPDDNKSVRSKMSGISKLSFFSNLDANKRVLKNQTYKDLKKDIEEHKIQKELPVTIGGNNWAEINNYNQKLFEKEKKESKIKEFEIKKRMKETLDDQVREKIQRKSMEIERERVFDDIVLQHVTNMNNLEQEKKQTLKLKMLREKETIDKQLEDDLKRKRMEAIQKRRYEKDLGKYFINY